tara:strand:+ start:3015 stop:3185 length:171 start_codon:yes stop_codon:yes gene_type:complete
METYQLIVNDVWIKIAHRAVTKLANEWPGGDPGEQIALHKMKSDLDKLLLEVTFQE